MAKSILNRLYVVPGSAAAPLAASFTGAAVFIRATPLTGHNYELQCGAVTGVGTLTVFIDKSDDNGLTWQVAQEFEPVSTAGGRYQTCTIVAPHDKHLRVRGVVAGAFSVPTFEVVMVTAHDQWRRR
jgi:hypothetical protein